MSGKATQIGKTVRPGETAEVSACLNRAFHNWNRQWDMGT